MARRTGQTQRTGRKQAGRKPAAGRRAPGRAAGRDPVAAALELAAAQGWRHTTLLDIARRAHMPLADLCACYASKQAIFDEFAARIDAAMLKGGVGEEAGDSPRDRLLEIIMRRFDAMNPHKDAVRAIVRDTARDPVALVCTLTGPLRRSVTWMLEAAGLESAGPLGLLRQKGLGAIYLDALRVWLADDAPDQGRTLATLDARLRQAEAIMGYVRGLARQRKPERKGKRA